jgi:flagellar basal-body rod protein FlgG
VDSDGNHIQGSSGDLQVPTDASNIVIDQDGAIYADDVYVDTIQITDFEDYNYLKQYGDNFWETVDGAVTKDATYALEQGYTEQSNVNVIDEMVDMITITRAYEAGQKMIQTQDSLLNHSVNEVGKVG